MHPGQVSKMGGNAFRWLCMLILMLYYAGTQALVRPGSPHSSLSAEDRTTMLPICRAIALVDSCPSPYDKEALRFKVSD